MSRTTDVLERLMFEHSMNRKQLAEVAGVSPSMVTFWFQGKTKPSADALKRMSRHFGVSPEHLQGIEYTFVRLPDAEPRKAYAPLLGRVHAGKGSEPDTLDEQVPVPYEVWKEHPSAFLLQVDGDCMDKVLPPGCLVLADPKQEPRSGSIAAVSIDGSDYLVRRVSLGKSAVMLSPDSHNPEHGDIVIDGSDGRTVELVGTVVWFQPSRELS